MQQLYLLKEPDTKYLNYYINFLYDFKESQIYKHNVYSENSKINLNEKSSSNELEDNTFELSTAGEQKKV